MPSLISRGAMSGKGFGLTGQTGQRLVSTTFTANGNWIAPASTTSVATASGQGAAGVSDYIGQVAYSYNTVQQFTFRDFAPYAQWSDPYGNYATAVASLPTSFPNYGPSSWYTGDIITVASDNYWARIAGAYGSLSGTFLTSYNASSYGYTQTSGNITYSSLAGGGGGWIIDVFGYIQGGVGASSTALGKTFPGGAYTGTYPNGTGQPATTTTFTNIAVTPGASYPIVVPSGGFVTLEYYV